MVLMSAAALAGCVLAGCGSDAPDQPATKPKPIHGELSVDIRDTVKVSVSDSKAGADVDITITPSAGYGLAKAGGELTGKGRVEAFLEADSTLYTARFDAPASAGGPCDGKPVSLALSLHRRGKDAHVGGSLTAYCGASTWHGVPARVLRLAGDLPLP